MKHLSRNVDNTAKNIPKSTHEHVCQKFRTTNIKK